MSRSWSRPLSLVTCSVLFPLVTACASTGSGASDGGMAPVREAIGSQAGRPFSPAVRVGNMYYFSGKIGVSGETRAMESGRTAAEVHNIMESFRELLGENGMELSDVVAVTIYLTDIDTFGEMNEAYVQYFPNDPPARETVAVADLVAGATVEIGMVAVKR